MNKIARAQQSDVWPRLCTTRNNASHHAQRASEISEMMTQPAVVLLSGEERTACTDLAIPGATWVGDTSMHTDFVRTTVLDAFQCGGFLSAGPLEI